MSAAEGVRDDRPTVLDRQALWGVRVLLAAALARALGTGLDRAEVRELLEELMDRQGGRDA